MVHHPATIRGLHAQKDLESLAKVDLGGNMVTAQEQDRINEKFKEDGGIPFFGARVARWFDDRKITENATLDAQIGKLQEEFEELDRAIEDNNLIEMKDGIGDCAVVLAGMAHMMGMTFEECCEHAWNEIKDRTGHLNEHGIFVKD